MKVLLCERSFSGHRKTYMQWLSRIEGIDFFSYAPENIGFPEERHFPFIYTTDLASPSNYFAWAKQLRKIVRQNGIDVVHVLDGDGLMRYFGYGLRMPGGCKVIVTYHHFYGGLPRRTSYRLMNAGRSHRCVVHTDTLQKTLEQYGVSNVEHCEYPAFDFYKIASLDKTACQEQFQLNHRTPVIGIVGGLTAYKHILPFLRILQRCKNDFQLLICGRPLEITENEIEGAIAPYQQKVRTFIRALSDEEYKSAIAASDIIYCVYGTGFNGASGPLTDGVCCRKMILSCAHGSLGAITAQHHLGLTADVTDEADILRKTEAALSQADAFEYDRDAEAYREQLRPEHFLETYKRIYSDI